jgi:predicted MPP superfamily phosphohydrolase
MNERGTRVKRILAPLWVMGVLIGSATSIATWTMQLGGSFSPISNLLYIIALPGWIPMYMLGFVGIRTDPVSIVLANLIAWTFWCIVIAVVLQARSRIIAGKVQADDNLRQTDTQDNLSRRAFLTNSVLGAGAVAAVSSPSYATLVEPWTIKTRTYTLPIRDLPVAFDGLRLVQFSDPHLGPRVPESFFAQAVQIVVDLQPDVVLLTGDYIHDNMEEVENAAKLCGPMVKAAKYGAVGVLGNHDWWGDGRAMSRALQEQGVRMIDNHRVWLDPVEGLVDSLVSQHSIAFAGLGDLTEDSVSIPRAFDGIGSKTPRIVLAHQPDTAELSSFRDSNAPRVDLMCSGHTHGGQVRLPFIGTPLVPSKFGSKYAGGLVQGPAFPVVVSRGVGMSLLPIRFGVPPEIVEIILKQA